MRPALSAHLGYLFGEVPFAQRVAAARQAGFDAVEHPDPQAIIPAAELRASLDGEGVSFAQMAVVGPLPEHKKGIAAHSHRTAEFSSSLDRALDYAEAIGCPLLHVMAGTVPPDDRAAEPTYRANLALAAERCRGRPIRVLVEAISPTIVPGYFVPTLARGLRLADALAPEDVSFLLDTFHAAETGDDAAALLRAHRGRIAHIHIADHPGRHEPGTGALRLEAFLDLLIELDYRGAIGFEYAPTTTTSAGLGWVAAWKQRLEHISE